jgi:hypothetical protein
MVMPFYLVKLVEGKIAIYRGRSASAVRSDCPVGTVLSVEVIEQEVADRMIRNGIEGFVAK